MRCERSVGVARLGELGPILYHLSRQAPLASSKLLGRFRQVREILCREKILKFEPMRSSIRIANQWQKDFRRILVIEFVSEYRDMQRQGLIGEARRAGEKRI